MVGHYQLVVWGRQGVCNIQDFGGFGVVAVSWVKSPSSPLRSLIRLLFTRPSVSCGHWLQILLPQQGRVNRLFVKGRVRLQRARSVLLRPLTDDKGAVKWSVTIEATMQRCLTRPSEGLIVVLAVWKSGYVQTSDKLKELWNIMNADVAMPDTKSRWMVWCEWKWWECYALTLAVTTSQSKCNAKDWNARQQSLPPSSKHYTRGY